MEYKYIKTRVLLFTFFKNIVNKYGLKINLLSIQTFLIQVCLT